MSYNPNESSKKQISKLLSVLFLGVIAALLLSVTLTYYYSKENHYLLENVLISPSVLKEIENNKDKKKAMLDKIEYAYFDFKENKRILHFLTKDEYAKLYDIIRDDVSSEPISNEIENAFLDQSKAVLSVYMIQNHENELFQEVEFSYRGDYYRVKLRETTPSWIYFFHRGIYEILQNEMIKS